MAATASPRARQHASPRGTSPADDFKLNDVIRGLGAVESDPYRITALLIESLTPEQKDIALAAALPNFVQRLTRPGAVRGRIATSSSRWDGVKAIRGELAVLRASVFARGEWKTLGDCDRDDCLDLAARRDQRAADVAAEADRYREVGKALRKYKVAIVRDLPTEVTEAIFNA